MLEFLYRYRAAILRRVPIEPVDDDALIERIYVHAASSTDARRRIAWVTGAAIVYEAERLSDEPVAVRNVEVAGLTPAQIAGSMTLGSAVFA